MDKGLRTALWILSSLAVLWTIVTLISWTEMSAMMSGGMMNGMISGGMTIGMTLHMALTGIVMIGLVGVFIYLVVTVRRV